MLSSSDRETLLRFPVVRPPSPVPRPKSSRSAAPSSGQKLPDCPLSERLRPAVSSKTLRSADHGEKPENEAKKWRKRSGRNRGLYPGGEVPQRGEKKQPVTRKTPAERSSFKSPAAER